MNIADIDFGEVARSTDSIKEILGQRSQQDRDIAAIKSSSTSEHELQRIAKTGSRATLSAFKLRKELSSKITHILLHERLKDLGAVLSHPALPMNIVRKVLVEGEKHQVPYALRHPGITSDDVEKVFIRLDKVGELFAPYIENPLQESILKHKNLSAEFVNTYAKKNFKSFTPIQAFSILKVPNLLVDTLRLLMSMNNQQVSIKILEKENLDIEFLIEVAENGNPVAQKYMAENRRSEVIKYATDKWDLDTSDFPDSWFGSVAGWKWM